MAGPRKPPPLSRLPLLRRRSPKRKRRVKIRSAASRHAKTLKYCRTLAASGYKTKTALSATSQKKISAQDWKKRKKLLTKPADNGGLKTKKPLVITRDFLLVAAVTTHKDQCTFCSPTITEASRAKASLSPCKPP